jgi:adenine-specific DNA methylase
MSEEERWKEEEIWETLVNSLLDSGLIMTDAWPIRTEMASRLIAKETASLASSIYIVARKIKRKSTGFCIIHKCRSIIGQLAIDSPTICS